MTDRPLWLAFLLGLCLAALPILLPGADLAPAHAEDGPPGEEDDPDLGDKKLPFAEQVNQAIEHGVNWLLAKPELFDIPEARDDEKGAFWGRIKGKRLYGGGKGPGYPHPAGTTALALYTLLKCGVSPKHQIIKKGFNWLRVEHRITKKWDDQESRYRWDWTEAAGSYELSAMILALTARWDPYKKTAKSKSVRRKGRLRMKNAEDREWLQRMVDGLVARRGIPKQKETARKDMRGWRYNIPPVTRQSSVKRGNSTKTDRWQRANVVLPPHSNQDLSSTQLAALALYSAHRFGVNVDPQVWFDIAELTLHHQEDDGPDHERHVPGYKEGGYAVPKDKARGFRYIPGSPSHSEGKATGSMTACGVANLLMAKEFLANHKKARKDFLDSELPRRINRGILDGMAWLDRNWSSFKNRGSSYGYHIYYLYGLERCMDMQGKKLVGKHLWYETCAKELLAIQNRVAAVDVPKSRRGTEKKPGVFWMTDATHDPKDVLDTCFALLFLKRATWGLVPPTVVTGD